MYLLESKIYIDFGLPNLISSSLKSMYFVVFLEVQADPLKMSKKLKVLAVSS